MEMTLSIIKPDAVERQLIGEIYRRFEENGFQIVAAKMRWLSRRETEKFYEVHADRPFYQDLVAYMTSGPVMIQVLAGLEAVSRHRALMGATNPAEAEPGTIRADLAQNVERNSVHGSDSAENAAKEIAFFFAHSDLCPSG